jgi:hypothetical protein
MVGLRGYVNAEVGENLRNHREPTVRHSKK